MTIQEAINKAVAGGYHIDSADGVETYYSGANNEWLVWTRTDNLSSFMTTVEQAFLDPAFWRAFGVTLGCEQGCSLPSLTYEQWWRQSWHRFIDHLADGKTPETFFASIDSCTWLQEA